MDIVGEYMKDIKVIFMGTPLFSVAALESLIDKCNVIAVVTQPDKGNSNFSPVKKVALKNNINLLQPINIKNDYKDIIKLKPDIIITCAYGQIIPKELLSEPKFGCVNIHASLLPKLRGGAPIHRAIMAGYSKTGITIMYMSEKMDAGDIISQVEIEISDTDDVKTLHNRLSFLGRDLIIDTLPDIISGNINPIKQDESDVTYAWNIKREDEKINFDKHKKEIYNKVRGLNPWPGAYCIYEGKICKVYSSKIGENYFNEGINGQIVKIYTDGIGIKVANGEIIFTEIQLEGKRKMSVKDFLNGVQDKEKLIGKVLE